MPEYRLYHFRDGHIVKAESFAASDDRSAEGAALSKTDERMAELWRGAIKLRTFNGPDKPT